MTKKIKKDGRWVTDSDGVSLQLINSIIFKNKIIEEFLDYEGKYVVCAVKGVGKTMLLRTKRASLERSYKGSAVFIPSNKPFLVSTEDFGELSNDVISYYSDFSHCKKLWNTALKISVISYCSDQFDDEVDLSRMYDGFDYQKNECVLPTDVVFSLFSIGVSSAEKFMNKNANYVNRLFRRIQSGAFLFIDRLDQTLSHYKRKPQSREFWINMQAGLVEAAWEIRRSNQHVKIYTSIRQEAFANYYSENKNAMESEISFIEYTHEDLEGILDNLSREYEEKESFTDLIGFEKIINKFSQEYEDTFSYMHRHTLGRPRDLVQICSNLCNRIEINEEVYRREVNIISGITVENYFEENSIFLDSLDSEYKRRELFSKLPSNILTFNELKDICAEYNGCVPSEFSLNSEFSHPFCELYNVGLLGIVGDDNLEDQKFQRFLEPYQRMKEITARIPDSDYYFLHPSLETLIEKTKDRCDIRYELISGVAIGSRCPWSNEISSHVQAIKIIRKCRDLCSDEKAIAFAENFASSLGVKNVSKNKPKFLENLNSAMTKEFSKEIAKETVGKISQLFGVVDGI